MCVKIYEKKIRKHDIVITFLSLPAIPYFFPPIHFPQFPQKENYYSSNARWFFAQ